MELSVLRTLLSGPKLPSVAALLRVVVHHKGETRLIVVYCSNLHLNRNTHGTWASIERAFHLRKNPCWLLIVHNIVR